MVSRPALWTLEALFTGAALWLVFSFVPLADVAGALARARPGPLVVAVPLALSGPFLSAGRLKALTDTQGMRLSFLQIVRVNFIAMFYGLALPGQIAAGAVRWHRLVRLDDRKAEVLAALVYARLHYLGTLVLFGVVFLAADLPNGVYPGAVSGLVLLLACLLVIGWIGARAERSAALRGASGGVRGFVFRLALAAGRYRGLPRRSWLRVAAFSTAENLAGTVVMLLFADAVGVDLRIATAGWVRAVIQTLIQLPVSISGLGIREAGLVVLLEPYGASSADAVAISFLLLGQLVLVAVVGLLLELLGSARPPSLRRSGAGAAK